MIKNIQIGDIIGLHSKVIKINHGSYGSVYICEDIRYPIKYALKTVKEDILKSGHGDEYIQLFKREAWNWINLNQHPNIVAAYDFLIQDYRPFLRLEAICPENGKQCLTDYLDDDLEEITIIDWGIQFAYGMEYAHSHGILAHKDLKPDNILIINNILKISDFGLANFYDKTFKNILGNGEDYNIISGTAEYSAPECFEKEYSIKSDIYSFGIIFYQLINNGKLPFNAEYDEDYKILHKTKEPKKLNSDLWPIISKCLEKDPNARYENFKDLKEDLINLFSKKSDKPHYKPIITQYTNILEDKAEKNLNFGFIDEAEIEYRKAIAENPNNFILQFNLAVSLLNNRKIAESKKIFKELENKGYSIPELYYNLGNIYRIKEEYEKSIKYFKIAIDLSIDSFDYLQAYINLANVYRATGELLKSIIYLKKAYSLKPKCLIIVNNLALSYIDNNNFMEAKELLNKFHENIKYNDYIGNTKEVSGFFYIWGNLCLEENNNQKALAMFDESISINKDNIDAHLNLISTEIKFGIYNRENKLKELINNHDDNRLKYLLGNLYFINEKFVEGIDIYNQIIIEDFGLENGFFMLNYLLDYKDYSKLLILFNKFIDNKLEENDNDIIYLTFKGMLYLENNNFEEAEKILENVLNIEPKNFIGEKYYEVFSYNMDIC